MENHQVWSPPPEHIWMRIAVKGDLGDVQQRAREGVAHFMLKGVSINFERSIDFVSRETKGAERTNLCMGPCDEYRGKGAFCIRITTCRENGNKPLTNTTQLVIFSRKKKDPCVDGDIERKGREFFAI